MNRFLKIIMIFLLLYPYTRILSIELEDKLVVLEVINPDLLVLLDEIIEHEKQCDYYTPGLNFNISFIPNEKNLSVNIYSIVGRMYKFGNEQGIFEYKGYTIIVSGVIQETIFSITENEIIYDYETIKDNYDPITGEFILWIIEEDDSYSYWTYEYVGNKFILKDISTYCK